MINSSYGDIYIARLSCHIIYVSYANCLNVFSLYDCLNYQFLFVCLRKDMQSITYYVYSHFVAFFYMHQRKNIWKWFTIQNLYEGVFFLVNTKMIKKKIIHLNELSIAFRLKTWINYFLWELHLCVEKNKIKRRRRRKTIVIKRIQLMCVLRANINHSFWKSLYEKLKKLSTQWITFSFFIKSFLKWIINIYHSTY